MKRRINWWFVRASLDYIVWTTINIIVTIILIGLACIGPILIIGHP